MSYFLFKFQIIKHPAVVDQHLKKSTKGALKFEKLNYVSNELP